MRAISKSKGERSALRGLVLSSCSVSLPGRFFPDGICGLAAALAGAAAERSRFRRRPCLPHYTAQTGKRTG